jgi:hypothetical protein
MCVLFDLCNMGNHARAAVENFFAGVRVVLAIVRVMASTDREAAWECAAKRSATCQVVQLMFFVCLGEEQ